jgi:hypothetical protein
VIAWAGGLPEDDIGGAGHDLAAVGAVELVGGQEVHTDAFASPGHRNIAPRLLADARKVLAVRS